MFGGLLLLLVGAALIVWVFGGLDNLFATAHNVKAGG